MFIKEKGQIQIVFLLLIIIGFVLFTVLTKEPAEPESEQPSKPIFKERTIISPPIQEEETPSTPTPVAPIPSTPTSTIPTTPAPDATPPHRSNPQPKGDLPAETRKTIISLETDEKATCRYTTISGMSYDSMMHVFSNTGGLSHSTQVTGLSEGGDYKYYIRCADEYGNKNTDDFEIPFKVKIPEDITPPERRNAYPTGDTLPAGTTETIIGISTGEPAHCRYDTEQGTSYNSMRRSLADDGTKKYHTARMTGLEDGQRYNYFVRCRDSAGNANSGDVMISFRIGTSP